MIIGIDHVLVAVSDVAQAMETYRNLGFEVRQGGEHPRFGTHNALVPLADGGYLELIGVKNRDLATQFPHTRLIVEALARENRLANFALDARSLQEEVEAIRKRGVKIEDPSAGERLRPDGQQVAWKSAHPENLRLPFLIEDVTPREVRISPPIEGVGRSLSLHSLTVGAQNAQPFSGELNQYTGVQPTQGVFQFQRGAIQVVENGRSEWLIEFVLKADNLVAIAQAWNAQDVPSREEMSELLGKTLVPLHTEGVNLRISG
jgi:hypothetical protein